MNIFKSMVRIKKFKDSIKELAQTPIEEIKADPKLF